MTKSSKFPLVHFFLCLIFSLLLIFLSSQNRLNFLSASINFTLTPVRIPFFFLHQNLAQQLSSIRQIPHQDRLIKDLKRQNAVLSVQAQRVGELEKENTSLKQALSSLQSFSSQLLPVKIIGINRFAFLNQGSKHGLKVGQPLVVNNVFLGLISSTSLNTARATLLNDPDLNLEIITNQNISGKAKFLQNQYEVTQILQKDPLYVDDRLFTKTTEAIPGNLFVGTVTQILENQSSVYQTAIYRPAVSVSDLDYAFVILD